MVNATGWQIGDGFETITVPSMRMVVDLSDFDASGWNHLTGTSGHTFHPNYVDQTPTWQRAELTPWAFSRVRGGCGDDPHSDADAGRLRGQPPAAGGVCLDSASSSTNSARSSIVPLR